MPGMPACKMNPSPPPARLSGIAGIPAADSRTAPPGYGFPSFSESVLIPAGFRGESGASAFGCIAEIMRDKTLVELKNKLKLDENSKVLFFSTEGDTDKENYKSIVWDGAYQRN